MHSRQAGIGGGGGEVPSRTASATTSAPAKEVWALPQCALTPVKTASYILAVLLGFGGLVFLLGSQGSVTRIITGVVLIAAGIVLAFLARIKSPQPTVIQQIDLSGDVHAEHLKCKACGGILDPDSVSVEAGGIFVKCPYCGTSYQLEEEPKW